MRRSNKNSNHTSPEASGKGTFLWGQEIIFGANTGKLITVFVSTLMILSVIFAVTVVINEPEGILGWAHSMFSQVQHNQEQDVHQDKLLGGLLIPGFDDDSCLSRYQSADYYGKPLFRKPSSYLISRLRTYEAHHKRCGPHTESYRKALEHLKSGKKLNSSSSDCNYLVWVPFCGLGNKILTIVSGFLYALLTNRILLVDQGPDMSELFCEPFPEASWFLPRDFPLIPQFNNLDQKSRLTYGNMLKKNALLYKTTNATVFPPSIYFYLAHDNDDQDKLFYHDEYQTFLQKVPWVLMKSNLYFVPSLFLMPSFEQELNKLFPEKGTIFHFLSRYLLHPTNKVWDLITRYYQTYLAGAHEKIGIQVREFEWGDKPFPHILDQVLSCALNESILPEINKHEIINNTIYPVKSNQTKAVVVTSLRSWYFEKIKDMYWEYPTITGDIISFSQPSNEQYQQTDKQDHDFKAWAEIYLLSLTDKLVTSARSTFGYVAQGLGGLRPWILKWSDNHKVPNPPCGRVSSSEPCFLTPPDYDKKKWDKRRLGYYVEICEDVSWGTKLFDVEKNEL